MCGAPYRNLPRPLSDAGGDYFRVLPSARMTEHLLLRCSHFTFQKRNHASYHRTCPSTPRWRLELHTFHISKLNVATMDPPVKLFIWKKRHFRITSHQPWNPNNLYSCNVRTCDEWYSSSFKPLLAPQGALGGVMFWDRSIQAIRHLGFECLKQFYVKQTSTKQFQWVSKWSQ